MKIFRALLVLLLIVMVSGCHGGPPLQEPTGKKVVTIERSIALWRWSWNTGFKIACNDAYLNYNTRTITIEGATFELGSFGGNNWVGTGIIRDDKLIILLPDKTARYYVTIGDERHILSQIK